MFYKLIEKKRDEWLGSDACTVKELLHYIQSRGMMRDAQLEAIKTYLYLKVACQNRPLWELFVTGAFNDIDISQLEVTDTVRQIFQTNKAAVALFQYSRTTDKNGRQLAPELEHYIRHHADAIDYEAAFRKIFYGVNYPDYLFSLPMGAGKTYLMAAFIHLELYFASNEPDNPCFAHNFMVMAPSGLKSSIVPSLKHIQEFDPTWVLPEPDASKVHALIKFEILDEQKSANKSNLVKNPNAQKISNYQPFDQLMGLVAVTNAEKVILDRFNPDQDPSLFTEEEQKRMILANELRSIIGQLPHLAIYIDEVHHAADRDIKLRQVVNEWTQHSTFNAVLGFSGTPYLDSAEELALTQGYFIKNTDLANVVYYYPLIAGIRNFLKVPVVKYADSDTTTIVTNGVHDFLEKYRDTVYANGTCAKLAIYCGQIETLEETVCPLVMEMVANYGLNAADVVLRYHGGNKQYPQPAGSEAAFAALDTAQSRIKIVLLVQIGKEGWDCKSLTGVILPQKGVCPTNMVLQTSCRCLRQVDRHQHETAIIWLNKFNADKLNRQLEQQQNITLREFSDDSLNHRPLIDRYSRMEQQHVPPIDFYQLKVSYETLTVDDHTDTASRLQSPELLVASAPSLVHQQDLEGQLLGVYELDDTEEVTTSYQWWLHQIAKESYGALTMSDLRCYDAELHDIFAHITANSNGVVVENNAYDHARIRSLVRQAFLPVRRITMTEEIVPEQASLLQIGRLATPVEDCASYYPDQQTVHEIVDWDNHAQQPAPNAEVQKKLAELAALGVDVSNLMPHDPHPERKQTYHYLPYRFDSSLEQGFFVGEVLPLIRDRQLEVYYNGDDTLTEFKVNCYTRTAGGWRYIGKYVPDFLLLSRDGGGQIDKVVIIETKGEGFAANFKERRQFMQDEFVGKNNERFGYQRFSFLYLEDTLTADQRRAKTLEAINTHFNQ